MSLDTFKVRPLTKQEKKRYKEHRERFPYNNQKPKLAGPCWLCGYKCAISKWSAHLERHRKEGWKPHDSKAHRPAAVVFAEWQQQDATPEDYGSLGEYRRLTGQK